MHLKIHIPLWYTFQKSSTVVVGLWILDGVAHIRTASPFHQKFEFTFMEIRMIILRMKQETKFWKMVSYTFNHLSLDKWRKHERTKYWPQWNSGRNSTLTGGDSLKTHNISDYNNRDITSVALHYQRRHFVFHFGQVTLICRPTVTKKVNIGKRYQIL